MENIIRYTYNLNLNFISVLDNHKQKLNKTIYNVMNFWGNLLNFTSYNVPYSSNLTVNDYEILIHDYDVQRKGVIASAVGYYKNIGYIVFNNNLNYRFNNNNIWVFELLHNYVFYLIMSSISLIYFTIFLFLKYVKKQDISLYRITHIIFFNIMLFIYTFFVYTLEYQTNSQVFDMVLIHEFAHLIGYEHDENSPIMQKISDTKLQRPCLEYLDITTIEQAVNKNITNISIPYCLYSDDNIILESIYFSILITLFIDIFMVCSINLIDLCKKYPCICCKKPSLKRTATLEII